MTTALPNNQITITPEDMNVLIQSLEESLIQAQSELDDLIKATEEKIPELEEIIAKKSALLTVLKPKT